MKMVQIKSLPILVHILIHILNYVKQENTTGKYVNIVLITDVHECLFILNNNFNKWSV